MSVSKSIAAAAAAAVCALGASAIAASGTPTLGSNIGPPTKGFGQVKPKTVFLGGDPTGLVEKLSWKSWGAATAVGTGSGSYVPAGQITANAVPATVTLTASSLGMCRAHLAYRRMRFTFQYNGRSYRGATYGICGRLS